MRPVELRSIVIRTYGNGNAPQLPWLLRLVKEATYRGITVVNVSQCVTGNVEMSRYDTGYQLKELVCSVVTTSPLRLQ